MKKLNFTILFLLTICSISAQIKVSCIGNSITEGWNGNPSYIPSLQQLLGDEYKVQNYGKSGASVVQNADVPYMQQKAFSQALISNADIITILLGTNDTKPQNWETNNNNFETDYISLIDTLQSTNKNAKIFLVIPVPVCTDNFGIRNEILNKIIPIIKQIAIKKDLAVIDANTPLLSSCNFFNDGVHPNKEGADAIAKLFYKEITK